MSILLSECRLIVLEVLSRVIVEVINVIECMTPELLCLCIDLEFLDIGFQIGLDILLFSRDLSLEGNYVCFVLI